MTDIADVSRADNTHPTVPVGIACAPQVFPEATPAWPQPPASPGDGSPRSDRRPWRDPGTMTGAIIAAMVGGLVAATLYAWLAPMIHF